jgi:hypothetical protein
MSGYGLKFGMNTLTGNTHVDLMEGGDKRLFPLLILAVLSATIPCAKYFFIGYNGV